MKTTVNSQNNIIKSYCSDVSKALLCEKKEKKQILFELKKNVEEYLSDNPGAEANELQKVFGTPKEIAESAMHGEDIHALKKRMTIRRIIIIAIILALLIWACFAIASLIDVHNEAHGFFEEGLMTIFTNSEVPLC